MRIRVLLTVLAAVVATSCATPEAQPPATTATSAKPMLAPLDVPAEPAWSTSMGGHPGDDYARAARLWSASALVLGYDGFQLIDVSTGTTRWTVTRDTDLDGVHWSSPYGYPILIGGAVVVPYSSGPMGSEEVGLLMLSSPDGHVVWRTPVLSPAESGRRLRTNLWAADNRVALVTVSDGDGKATRPTDLRMIAVNTQTGAVKWERTGTWPRAIVGDTVIGVNSTAWRSADGVVAGFDVTTGAPSWDVHDRYEGSNVVLTAGGLVLAQVTEKGKQKLTLLSATTGTPLTDFGDASEPPCVTDGAATILCQDRGNTMSAYLLADRSFIRMPSHHVTAVWRDRLFVEGAETYYSVDLAGNRIDQRLPGEPIAVNDDYLIVRRGDDTMSGYPLG